MSTGIKALIIVAGALIIAGVYSVFFKVARDCDESMNDLIDNEPKKDPVPEPSPEEPKEEPAKEDVKEEVTNEEPIPEESNKDEEFKSIYDKYKNKEITAKSAYESLGWSRSKFYREVKKYENFKALERANINGE